MTHAYSYIRFSTPEQREGDSLRRQTAGAAEWCARNNVTLDDSLTLHELGKSAFRGKHRSNPDRDALAAFLKAVKQGRVARGSYLIIENLDRLSREDERTALRLWMDILDAGVSIVQLKPETIFRHEKSDMFDIMRAIMELSRGHGESAMKSVRNGAAWHAKVVAAREGKPQPARKKDGKVTRAITDRLPAWVMEREGKLALHRERAAVVKKIFGWASDGYGFRSIIQRLTKEGVKAWGRSGRWNTAYLWKILADRRAVGELQPYHKATKKPNGPPIPNYYPPVVTEAEWAAARAGAAQRRQRQGRIGSVVNVFAGLLHNIGQNKGDKFIIVRQGQRDGGKRVLVNTFGHEGLTKRTSFPADVFERAVFGLLAEINPSTILSEERGPDKLGAYEGELGELLKSIAGLTANLERDGFSETLAGALRKLEGRKAQLDRLIEEERQRVAHPLSRSWDEAKSLLTALDGDDGRLRLRSALRRIVVGIGVLINVHPNKNKSAYVQMIFAGGDKKKRSYLIDYNRRTGESYASSVVLGPGQKVLSDETECWF